MICELSTVDVQTNSTETEDSASNLVIDNPLKRLTPLLNRIIMPITGIMLAISATPTTAVADYWTNEFIERNVITVPWITEKIVRTPISRVEAIRVARNIIERAEYERLTLVKLEAQSGLTYGEEA